MIVYYMSNITRYIISLILQWAKRWRTFIPTLVIRTYAFRAGPAELASPSKRRRGWQRMKWLDSITDSVDMNLSKLWETVKDREAWHAIVHGVTKIQTQLSN